MERIPVHAFVIIWVNRFLNTVEQYAGKDIYIVSCRPDQVCDMQERFERHRIIYSEDGIEAFDHATGIAERIARHPAFQRRTTYIQVAPAA